MAEQERRVDLVLEGGGVKGLGLAGAYAELHARGYRPMNVAGTSAGAITAAAIAVGYGPDELRDLIMGLDYRQFEDKGWEDRVPLVPRTVSILRDLGIYEGNRFEEWMGELVGAKGKSKFGELVVEGEEDLRYRYRLQVIASDVTERCLLVLPRDAHKLGIDPDELEIATAVRMSMSLPIFFEPYRHENPKTGREHLIVDGGILSNFPVWLFDCPEDEVPEWPTFGLLLVDKPRAELGDRLPPARAGRGVGAVADFLRSLALTMMEAHDRLYLEQADFARTITIDTIGVRTTDFDIAPDRAQALYESGRIAGGKFLDDWDFEAYIAAFRSRRERPTRRDAVVAELRAEGAVSTEA